MKHPEGRLFQCSRCRKVCYCQPSCQKKDYKRHKQECQSTNLSDNSAEEKHGSISSYLNIDTYVQLHSLKTESFNGLTGKIVTRPDDMTTEVIKYGIKLDSKDKIIKVKKEKILVLDRVS